MSFCLDGLCYALASGWLTWAIFFLGFFVGAGAWSLRARFSRARAGGV